MTDTDYSKVPVHRIIGTILRRMHECPMLMTYRSKLEDIRRDIFIELPETRCEMLCKVGHVINEMAERKEEIKTLVVWDEIKTIMNSALEEYR